MKCHGANVGAAAADAALYQRSPQKKLTIIYKRPCRGFTGSSSDPSRSAFGCRFAGIIPWRGALQIGHASAFKVISAPQHEQKAAMTQILPTPSSYDLG